MCGGIRPSQFRQSTARADSTTLDSSLEQSAGLGDSCMSPFWRTGPGPAGLAKSLPVISRLVIVLQRFDRGLVDVDRHRMAVRDDRIVGVLAPGSFDVTNLELTLDELGHPLQGW